MQLNAKMLLIGTEPYKTAKGNDYVKIALAQGADTISMLSTDFGLLKAKPLVEYDCVFSYNTQYKRLELECMRSIG